MKRRLIVGASAVGLTLIAVPAGAEQMNMPGMAMSAPAKKAPKKAPAKTRRKSGRKSTVTQTKVEARNLAPARNPRHALHGTAPRGKRAMRMPMSEPQSGAAVSKPTGQSQMRSAMPGSQMGSTRPEQVQGSAMAMPMGEAGPTPAGSESPAQASMGNMPMQHGAKGMSRTGALGSYPQQRESAGTAWEPDSSMLMAGPMLMAGDWMLMAHGTVNMVYDHQSGPRGNEKAFASGMLMGMARHPLGDGTIQLRGMVSPDPLMGPRGYPLLLATGETANGKTPLIDRQHPHDFFMELSASISQNLGSRSSAFIYAGLPGEPAFGPPAFMHREAILDSPEAPITHHWLDSTHISFGVVTAGFVLGRFKLEARRFNAREPDQHRWNIETGPLDSTSLRLSWNPVRTLALQASWGHFKDPEQLEPGVDQTRWSASALWADDLARGWHAAATLAWGRKSSLGHSDDAVAAEASIKHSGWTLFGRGEWVENRELLDLVDSPAYRVGKVSVGAVRDFRISDHLSLGAGGLFSLNFVPDALAPLYGSHHPSGEMAFVRLKLD